MRTVTRLTAFTVVVAVLATVCGLLIGDGSHLATVAPTTPTAFAERVHNQYPHLTEEQASTWVRKVCATFREGYTLSDMPLVEDKTTNDMYLYLIRAGVPTFCPDQTAALIS